MSHILIVHGSIVECRAQAIVNAANCGMRGGGGLDGAMHAAAGPGMLAELTQVAPKGAKTSEVMVTDSHDLESPTGPFFVFHVAGPVWQGGDHGEAEALKACYVNCLDKAKELQLKSIAFPSISTGIYGYPLELACPIAVEAVRDYRGGYLETISFVMYTGAEYAAYAAMCRGA